MKSMLLLKCMVRMEIFHTVSRIFVLYETAGTEQASIVSQLEKAPVGAFFDSFVTTCSSKVDISAQSYLLYMPNPLGLYR